ncbi:MAG: DUF2341 domain-containing protein, partial [Dehalococcoidales bacterium]|nr:DUF2341 domain-containing protein [Dehalococcoidales bacterium]
MVAQVLAPADVLAANGSWSQTTFNGTSDGTYTNTVSANANADLSLGGYTGLTNAGGVDWDYRRPVTIDNSVGGTLTDYQVKITVTYDTDMQADFDDLRFTDDNGTSELYYWIESYTASTSATVWVKVPSINAASSKTVYMYYGNLSATSSSNGGNTFDFFDDFDRDNSSTVGNNWTESGTGTTEILNNELHVQGPGDYVQQALTLPSGDYAVEHLTRQANSTGIGHIFVYDASSRAMNQVTLNGSYGSWPKISYWRNAAAVQISSSLNTAIYYRFIQANIGNTQDVWMDETKYASAQIFANSAAQQPLKYIRFRAHDVNYPGNLYVKFTFVRKYTATEPSVLAGAETAAYNTSGNYKSAVIQPTGLYGNWGTLTWNATLAGQTLTVDVLNGSNENVIQTGVASGTNINLSTATYPSLKLRANLSTADPAATPLLNDWSLGYTYDTTGPTGSTLSWGTITNTAIDIAASGAADNEAGLRGDNLTYYIERDNNATSFVSADANSGWVTGAWSQNSLTSNTPYSYRVKTRDVLGNESGWVNPSPGYKYTLTNIPVLDSPTSHTEDSKPPVSNSATPDLSIASRPVKLYDDGSLVAETTANGSGVFTFAVGDYTFALSDGEHLNITARALNGDNVESADSAPITIHVDTDPPSPPTTVDVAREGSAGGAEILDNTWNQHNSGATLYFEFSGATDLPIPPNTGIKRYWVYFGSNGSALPRTDGQATADSTLNVTKTLSSPVTGTDYYLRIQSEDDVGNISDDGSVTTLFTYKFDN